MVSQSKRTRQPSQRQQLSTAINRVKNGPNTTNLFGKCNKNIQKKISEFEQKEGVKREFQCWLIMFNSEMLDGPQKNVSTMFLSLAFEYIYICMLYVSYSSKKVSTAKIPFPCSAFSCDVPSCQSHSSVNFTKLDW